MNLKQSSKAIFKKYPVGIISATITIVALGLCVFRYSAIADLHASLASKNKQAQIQSTNITHSAQLEEQLNALHEANKTIEGRLVNPQELAINLQYFYKLETDTGVKLLDAHSGAAPQGKPQASKSGYKPVPYIVTLKGSFAQAVSFIRKLEQGNSYCRIMGANYIPAQEESAEKSEAPAVILTLTIEILGKT